MDLIEELHNEWRFRYGHSDKKFHKAYIVSLILRENIPRDANFDKEGLTSFALAIPIQYKTDDTGVSYRNYYVRKKAKNCFMKKKKRENPEWYIISS